jgi:hypothetical protein
VPFTGPPPPRLSDPQTCAAVPDWLPVELSLLARARLAPPRSMPQINNPPSTFCIVVGLLIAIFLSDFHLLLILLTGYVLIMEPFPENTLKMR